MTELLDLSQLGALVVASVVLLAVPGPAVLFVVGRALRDGRDIALFTAVGNAVGCY
ncbi:MAG: hypothetical protein L0K02_00110 [Corynebacterium sp.]|nr:hypothetical protein [Corynebacterium sp.]